MRRKNLRLETKESQYLSLDIFNRVFIKAAHIIYPDPGAAGKFFFQQGLEQLFYFFHGHVFKTLLKISVFYYQKIVFTLFHEQNKAIALVGAYIEIMSRWQALQPFHYRRNNVCLVDHVMIEDQMDGVLSTRQFHVALLNSIM